ncbi:MAG: DUF5667 domain-containing protein [Candidatus Curtissbacteria bacterium]|nr:DUF5667 domain-containing protein [Candidatus Curtissbacteria bacterium]
MIKTVSACLLALFIFFIGTPTSFARTEYNFRGESQGQANGAIEKIVPIRFLPSHPFYFSIRIKEVISRFFQPSAAKKTEFDLQLSGKRIKEAYLEMENGNLQQASKSLSDYTKRLDKMGNEFEKARSQNQSVASLSDKAADDLRLHETLLDGIHQKFMTMDDGFGFDENFEAALAAHVRVIMIIDNVKPGVRDRFVTPTFFETQQEHKVEPSPTPNDAVLFQSTPGAKPKRIIY